MVGDSLALLISHSVTTVPSLCKSCYNGLFMCLSLRCDSELLNNKHSVTFFHILRLNRQQERFPANIYQTNEWVPENRTEKAKLCSALFLQMQSRHAEHCARRERTVHLVQLFPSRFQASFLLSVDDTSLWLLLKCHVQETSLWSISYYLCCGTVSLCTYADNENDCLALWFLVWLSESSVRLGLFQWPEPWCRTCLNPLQDLRHILGLRLFKDYLEGFTEANF